MAIVIAKKADKQLTLFCSVTLKKYFPKTGHKFAHQARISAIPF